MHEPRGRSAWERFACLPQAERDAWMKGKPTTAITRHWQRWENLRRDDQLPPAGNWRVWLALAGRGFGKTRMAAEWVREQAEADPAARIALVAATMAEARAIMVEGDSGLLAAASDPARRPVFEPSLRRLTWPNGAMATLYSAAEPESLRGPQHSLAWADEIAKWDNGEAAWINLELTMRLGIRPRIVATTTPRPVPLLRRLVGQADVARTRGRSEDNRANLPSDWMAAMRGLYGGTRLGRQELDGDLIGDIEGALWNRDALEACRVGHVPPLRRVVVGVDPPAGSDGDACGIVAVGKGEDGKAYVLEDASVSGRSPEGWARAVAACVARVAADKVVAEANNGGKMVETVLRGAAQAMPVKLVHASRGKVARAEPVAALYGSGRACHAGAFPALEDELCGLVTGGTYQGPGRSPDRADALVWAMTELMLGEMRAGPRIRLL